MFGFGVSQCALQLPTQHGHVDLAHPLALLLYFATFALIASLWLTFHRLMSGTFRASGIDLAIAFSYLALVSLIPYAMYSITHENASLETAQRALASYTALYAAMSFLAAVLSLRNLRRGYVHLEPEARRLAWVAVLRQTILCAMMAVGCAIDGRFGPTWAGVWLIGMQPAIAIARRCFPLPPSSARLGVRAQ